MPEALRRPAFAVVADLLLDDGRIDPKARRFLQALERGCACGARSCGPYSR